MIQFDGSTWSVINGPGPVPVGGPSPPIVNDVWVASENHVYAITNTMVCFFDGTGWTILYENNQARMRSIWGFSNSDIYIAAYDAIFHFNGSIWTADSLHTVAGVTEIWGSDPSNIFAAGADEVLLYYNGMFWEEVHRGSESGQPAGLWGSGPADVYAAFNHSLLYFDGISWTPVSLPEDVRYIRAVWGSGTNSLFLFHGSGNIHHFDGFQWQEMNSQTHMRLYSAWGATTDNIFAVGENRKIIHFDGTEWSSVSGGAPSEPTFIWGLDINNIYIGNLASVFRYDGCRFEELPRILENLQTVDLWGTSPTHLVSVGRYGNVFHFDGNTWNRADVPTETYLNAVTGVAADAIWAVGIGTCIFYNGNQWIKIYEDIGNDIMFNDVWAASRNDVFLVGWDGVLARFDGAVWTFFEGFEQNHLFGVWGTSASNVYAVGDHIILHFDGRTWRRMPFPGYLGYPTKTFLTVTGSSATDIYTGGYSESIYHFNGSIWSAFPINFYSVFTDMWCSPGGLVFAIEYGFPYLYIYFYR